MTHVRPAGHAGLTQKLNRWLALLGCAVALAACGGGGGSPGGTAAGTPAAPKVGSVLLSASAATIDSSGLDGTEVTLTAIVKDGGNNALSAQNVSFNASSGTVSNTSRSTDSNGTVVEKLSVKGDTSLRTITITASAGGVTSAPITVNVVAAQPTLTLTADSGTLASSGSAGTEVTVVALVKDSNNNVVAGANVDLSADSGNLTYANHTTDAKGTVTAKLDTVGDPTSRKITVTAKSSGAKDATIAVTVAGNKLVINSNSTVKVGSTSDVSIKLVDSAGNALVGKPVTYSATNNALSVKGGGSAITNSAGQLVLSYVANTPGADTITVKSMGETATASVTVSAANFTVTPASGATATINTCQQVNILYDIGGVAQSGSVTLSSSRGTVYSDASCSTTLSGGLNLAGGAATGYVRATSPGVATLTATAGNLSTQTSLEFLAAYTSAATVIVQADPAVLGVNLPGSSLQQTTLRAIVRDGTAANNLVKNAQVAFSIVSDPSGGTLTQPAVVLTGSDGVASVSYIAGTSDTKLNGVTIQAQLQGGGTAVGTVNLTVGKKSLFITAGTGNTVGTPDPTTYQLDYAVFVTDAAGNPVPGVNITSSVRPRNYYKGQLYYNGTQGPWGLGTLPGTLPLSCANEDVNSDGLLQAGEDRNGDGLLTPGNAISVTSSATTDAKGQAIVSLRYFRDRANWLDFVLTIRGQVSGSEATYQAYSLLPGLGSDYATLAVAPPGLYSPYGKDNTPATGCQNTN